jgi:hypothetical protein
MELLHYGFQERQFEKQYRKGSDETLTISAV